MKAFAEFFSAQTQVMKSLEKKVKKKDRKRAMSASSDSDINVDKEAIDVAESLKHYGMHDINEEHLPAPALIESAVKKAKKRYANHRNTFATQGSLARKYAPFWMDKAQQPKPTESGPEWDSFAQFASFWWSRALTQLVAQGANGKETPSPTALINCFLDLCKMAQEHKGSGGSAYAYKYDYRLWAKMSDQLDKGSKDLDPQRDLAQPNPKVVMQVDMKFGKRVTGHLHQAGQAVEGLASPKTTRKTEIRRDARIVASQAIRKSFASRR